MTGQEILAEALGYRDNHTEELQRIYARFDLQAALDHALVACENCSHRFGSDPTALQEALALLG